MSLATKLNDKGTQHDGYYETVIIAGSSTVSIDGLPAARQGDPLTPHDKPKHPPHPRRISGGSSTVFIDGKPAARDGDSIDCGGVVVGSGTVSID
ncbi:type VI secretion system PAAR protein [Salmonella enterica subsp. salamae]|uniref:Type VI secretion system PAAR protein n=1 Tax=Salmonella enterica subsp. salamae TaxID=59202 RepID=A0A5Y3V7X3_SALER|nr:type VI secretion system PAAR protein [Salmonella enterica subsp. salamae]EEO8346952.1 type VI secretion system PAAR protein [Salmonella enterica]ECI3455004.1 type VI secretion system PAAR protein [Salmonella enterica subsp. salamae]ECJ2328627.1 type VI secretion system PAAR protein [Salmonella enterica subsp. salamae]EDV0905547.1 type VI secretion system PAAR protein [Salmonella enterica subsp. salamae]